MSSTAFKRVFLKVFCVIFLLGYEAHAANSLAFCELETIESCDVPGLLQEREEILGEIAAQVAKYIEIPFVPNQSKEYFNATFGNLLKVIEAETQFRKNLADQEEGCQQSLAMLVKSLTDIKANLSAFERTIDQLGKFRILSPTMYASTVQLQFRDNPYKRNLNKILAIISQTNGESKALLIPRNAQHISLGLGVSSTKYQYTVLSPLFFRHSYKVRSWSPKFGIALGAGNNGYTLTDSLINRYGTSMILFHPLHPLYNNREKQMTFNWEGSIAFLQGSVDHGAYFGTGGLSPLPIGFSIGPEFIPEIKAEKVRTKHDIWRFYELLDISQILSFD